jgi:dihydrofolate synthase/folylpolyglutamate synthase
VALAPHAVAWRLEPGAWSPEPFYIVPPEPTLASWLAYLERLHPRAIDLGLERAAAVRDRLGLRTLPFPVLTVGGTNGKGSTCAFLEAFLRAAGYRVGCYTSPHLTRYNERVRIAGEAVADDELVRAFERIEAAREGVSLTYFEVGTLAAVLLFVQADIDVAVLEVGLGGRLDAVNVFEPDCAIVTSIGLDHMNYLGPTREHIGAEKAGIFRHARPAVVAEPDPPRSLLAHAAAVGAELYAIDRDFGVRAEPDAWTCWTWALRRSALPWPALRGELQLRNAAAALAALDSLRERVPVDMGAIRRGLTEVELPGRFQVLPGRPVGVLDVAHNPQAAQALADNLARMGRFDRTIAVFSILRDKDIAAVTQPLRALVDRWFIAPSPGPRGIDAEGLRAVLLQAGVSAPVQTFASVEEAWARARGEAGVDGRIVAFGSFLTVGAVLEATQRPAS